MPQDWKYKFHKRRQIPWAAKSWYFTSAKQRFWDSRVQTAHVEIWLSTMTKISIFFFRVEKLTPTFRRNVPPPSSGQYVPPNRWYRRINYVCMVLHPRRWTHTAWGITFTTRPASPEDQLHKNSWHEQCEISSAACCHLCATTLRCRWNCNNIIISTATK